ncbi:MAG: hypothetical protein EOO28_29870 [Comamonadaceae bacterium]|nr:MAG: hypothetical protein EOO28_29870 [Comamonadaceae bacterium]
MLEFVGGRQPDLWEIFFRQREICFAEEPWEDWFYAPLRVIASMLPEHSVLLTMKYTAMATWRLTQGVYRIDPTLFHELARTPLDQQIPVDVLLRLPVWSLYIELPVTVSTFRGLAHGAWVWLERRAAGEILLYILFDTERDMQTSLDEDVMFPFFLKLRKGSLPDMLEETFRTGSAELYQELKTAVEPVISVLLYLCSQNADLTRNGLPAKPLRPEPVQTRRSGSRMFAAAKVSQWEVGVRMGAALRRAEERSGHQNDGESTGRRPIGHIRRAHWHTVLSGPIKNVPAENRRRELRWMPPVGVNLLDPDHLQVTVRNIR